MKFKKLISAALSAIMLTSAFPALADTEPKKSKRTPHIFSRISGTIRTPAKP